jgi:eukaryotic-like serine/threonine-protein kinase
MKGPAFETIVELGRGGMGTAHLARAIGIGGFERLVVIKRLNPGLRQRTDAVPRFLAEARIAGQVHHANVVGTQQVGSDDDGPFIVIDYVEGGTLDELRDRNLLRGAPIPVPIVLRIALDALAGLEAIHQARDTEGQPLSILHRDVSLQNVLVGLNDGVARISDFGVAKSAIAGVQTDGGYLLGKFAYLAPEYIRREPVGPTLDLYALGVTLWFAISGKDPWAGANEAQFVESILGDGVPPLGAHISVAPEIGEFVGRACHKEAYERFASAEEMADVIRRFDRERGWVASHAEVSAFVKDLLGVDLERRRELIKVVAATRRALPTERKSRTSESSRAWTPRRVLLITIPLGLAGAGLLVLTLGRSPAEQERVKPQAREPTSENQPAPVVPKPGTGPVPEVRPIVGSDAAGPEGVSSTSKAVQTTPSARPKSLLPSRDPIAPRVRPPDEIQSKNPYR